MFDIGLQEMLVIGVLALLVFGPSKLPELGRMVGRAMREFRRASDEFRSTVETNLHINDPDPIREPAPSSVDAVTGAGPVEGSLTAASTLPSGSEAVTTAVEAAFSEGANSEPFCAQRGSRLFHRRDCAWVGRIPEIERVYLKTFAEAKEQGFNTCPVCEPWEPA
jgi:TatA/E family protein of Tat protein translocase